MVDSIGARLEGIYYCPHAPEDRCQCRKPATALLDRAAAELGFDPSLAVVVGDKLSDVEFGRRAGATTVLIAKKMPEISDVSKPDYVVTNLVEAGQVIAGL
jgi:histidinol-phosphate phosphatase family protein